MTLKARCQGSHSIAYRVKVTFNDAEITEAGCSCPVGGYCKHVAAVLLAWQAHPEEFLEYQDLETILEQCDKADLINLIKHMVQRDDDLEPLVRTMVRREQIFSLLFTIFHFSIRAGHVTFGRWAPSILLEQTSAGERQTLARWVREAIDTRKQAVSRISYHTRSYHGFSFEEEVVSETLSYYGTRRLGSFLLELEADTLDDEAYLHICRETGRVSDLVERLLKLQRVDEVVQFSSSLAPCSPEAVLFLPQGVRFVPRKNFSS